jgi:hypothetical protein
MSELERALYRAAALTFEELAFALPMPEPAGCSLEELPTRARVAFHGPFAGQVVVAVADGMLPVLAANMLGEEAAPPRPEQEDALGELANVVCGNVLPAVAGREQVFHLDAPVPVPPGVDPARSGERLLASVALLLDEGAARISFFGDAACAAALGASG